VPGRHDQLYGVQRCDHTRGKDKKQSDDGIGDTFVLAGRGPSGLALKALPVMMMAMLFVAHSPDNRYQSTMDMHLRQSSSFSASERNEPLPRGQMRY
jgi:hypothetical protein